MKRGGFRADPDSLHQLAGGFEQAAGQVERMLDTFSSSVQDPPSTVFGLLPGSRALHAAYLQTAQGAIGGLRAVQGALAEDLAAGLRANAAAYLQADEASTRRPT